MMGGVRGAFDDGKISTVLTLRRFPNIFSLRAPRHVLRKEL